MGGVRKETRSRKGSLGEKRSSDEEAQMPLCTFAGLLPAYLFNLFPQDITGRRTKNHHTRHVGVREVVCVPFKVRLASRSHIVWHENFGFLMARSLEDTIQCLGHRTHRGGHHCAHYLPSYLQRTLDVSYRYLADATQQLLKCGVKKNLR